MISMKRGKKLAVRGDLMTNIARGEGRLTLLNTARRMGRFSEYAEGEDEEEEAEGEGDGLMNTLKGR